VHRFVTYQFEGDEQGKQSKGNSNAHTLRS